MSVPVASVVEWEVKWTNPTEKVEYHYRVVAVHDPILCNYAHADFRFFRDGVEVDEIKPNMVKDQLRHKIANSLFVHIEPPQPPV